VGEGEKKPRREALADRSEQILAAAERLILESGALPLPMAQIGREIGASRALVYAYFPTMESLIEGVLSRTMAELERAAPPLDQGLTLEDFGVTAADAYLAHVADRGPILHIILRDKRNIAAMAPAASAYRSRILRALARRLRRDFQMTPKESVAFVQLALAIPDEIGRMVFRREIALEEGRALCARLVRNSIRAVRPSRSGRT